MLGSWVLDRTPSQTLIPKPSVGDTGVLWEILLPYHLPRRQTGGWNIVAIEIWMSKDYFKLWIKYSILSAPHLHHWVPWRLLLSAALCLLFQNALVQCFTRVRHVSETQKKIRFEKGCHFSPFCEFWSDGNWTWQCITFHLSVSRMVATPSCFVSVGASEMLFQYPCHRAMVDIDKAVVHSQGPPRT